MFFSKLTLGSSPKPHDLHCNNENKNLDCKNLGYPATELEAQINNKGLIVDVLLSTLLTNWTIMQCMVLANWIITSI